MGLVTSSMVTVGVLTAVALTLLFRIGQRRRVSIDLAPTSGADQARDQVSSSMAELDVGPSAAEVPAFVAEIVDEVVQRRLADGEIRATVSTDDLEVRVDLRYECQALDLAPMRALGRDELTDENVFAAGLARYLDGPRPDDVVTRTRGDEVHVSLVYQLV